MPMGIPKNGINKGWFSLGHKTWNKDTKGKTSANPGSFKAGHKPWHKGKTGVYSKEMIDKLRKARLGKFVGEKHPRWKGGITKNHDGYILQSVNGKQVYQHRYVMEKHIGRKLTRNETVHHINGDKTDNRIENLEILTRSEHTRLYGCHSHITKIR